MYPYTQRLLQPHWIQKRRSVLYCTDPIRIWGLHKNSWIRIPESESGCIHITFSAIRRSRPSLDLELVLNGTVRGLKDEMQETGTALDYGPIIKIQVRIPYRSVHVYFLCFLRRIGKKAAEWPDPSPVLRSGPSRTAPQSSSHRILLHARWPRWRGQSRKTTTGPKSGFKEMESFELKHKMLASSGSQKMRICNWWRIRDSDPDLSPRPGLN